MTLPRELDGERTLRALARLGWHVRRTRGSHRVLVHDATGRVAVVAFHRRISRHALHRLLKTMGVPQEAFEDVW